MRSLGIEISGCCSLRVLECLVNEADLIIASKALIVNSIEE